MGGQWCLLWALTSIALGAEEHCAQPSYMKGTEDPAVDALFKPLYEKYKDKM